MKKYSISNLDANKSNVKEEVQETSCVKRRSLIFGVLKGVRTQSVFKYMCVTAIVIAASCFAISCSQDGDMTGLEISANEKSLNLIAPNGEKIAKNIFHLKEIVSVSVAERFGIDKDFDITSLEYVPVKDCYAVLIKYKTSDDIEGGILKTNNKSLRLTNTKITYVDRIRLKSGGENTTIINGYIVTCTPYPSNSTCTCIPKTDIVDGELHTTCDQRPSTCTGTCTMTVKKDN